MPKLSHQTAVVSLIQFVTIASLAIPNTIISIISSCHSDSTGCVSNMVASIIFYILTAVWFGLIMIIGFLAQKRRSRQFAVILICFEFFTLGVAGYIDFPHDPNFLSKATSLLDVILSLWVIYVSIRLIMSGTNRIVSKEKKIVKNKKVS